MQGADPDTSVPTSPGGDEVAHRYHCAVVEEIP